MKGLVKFQEGPGNVEIRDIEMPSPKAGEVLIEVKNAGLCGSDLHILHADIAIPMKPPFVMGHEFSGVVAGVGEGVTAFKLGDRVVSETAFSFCGKCHLCVSGFYNLCNMRRSLGYWYNGAFTNYTVTPQDRLHLLPESIDFVTAAMIEPMACVSHAIYDLSVINAADVVLVTGPGAIGLMAALIAKAEGAIVVMSGTDADVKRLEEARSLGIDHTINIQNEDLEKLVMELTNGDGAAVVIECAGNAAAANQGMALCKKRGYFVQIGLNNKPVTFNLDTICFRELKFSGSLGSTKAAWRRSIALLASKKVNIRPLATHVMPVTDWKKAFEMFERKEGGKLIFTPAE